MNWSVCITSTSQININTDSSVSESTTMNVVTQHLQHMYINCTLVPKYTNVTLYHLLYMSTKIPHSIAHVSIRKYKFEYDCTITLWHLTNDSGFETKNRFKTYAKPKHKVTLKFRFQTSLKPNLPLIGFKPNLNSAVRFQNK